MTCFQKNNIEKALGQGDQARVLSFLLLESL